MRNALLIGFLILVPVAASALPTGWFNVDRAYIEQLSEDSYRLNVSVSWGGEIWHPEYAQGDITPVLYGLTLGSPLGSSQSNPTLFDIGAGGSNDPGSWVAGLSPDPLLPLSLGRRFSYDFVHAGPIDPLITLDYRAQLVWAQAASPPFGLPGAPPPVDYPASGGYWHDQQLGGRFTANVVPEPTTLVLFGFGLVGVGVIRRFF